MPNLGTPQGTAAQGTAAQGTAPKVPQPKVPRAQGTASPRYRRPRYRPPKVPRSVIYIILSLQTSSVIYINLSFIYINVS